MRKTYVVLGLMLALTLVLSPGSAQALMWVGAQGGVNVIANTDIGLSESGEGGITLPNVKFDNPQAIGGVNIGYVFVKEGFLGYDYPDWMKYFMFSVDFTYNTFEIRTQDVKIGGYPYNIGPDKKGAMPVLTFLFMGRYGFLPDSEVPFGRLQPYVGVGPGIVFSSLDPGFGLGRSDSVDIALVAEAGVRWMALKNVALDASFRYRWFAPKYSFTSGEGETYIIKPNDINSFTALFRVSYLF
jgi:opacity protein-like surface antigen